MLTQPGPPATSSPDAELRGVSRAAREAIYLRDLITLDFGQLCGKPRLWTDSSSAMQAAKRIGPGAKLRHLEVCEFYAVRAQGQGNQWINPIVLYILAFIGLLAIYEKLYQLGTLITDWLFPLEGENQPEPAEGAEVQLQLDNATVRLNITAYRDGRQLNISQTVNAPAAAPRPGSAEAPQPQPAETPRQEELTPSRIERWSEEQWAQKRAESNMPLQEVIEWRRREERLIQGQDPDSSQDEPGESTSHSADSPASERDAPPERDEPPERVAPPERAEPPISS